MSEARTLATDGIIHIEGEVLLLERNHPPYEGYWVLPGGVVERGETAREACKREVQEEVGLSVTIEEFIGLYDEPGRDTCGNVSAAYQCRPLDETPPTARAEAHSVETFDPTDRPELGFDHEQIITDALLA